jgi:tetratricopeptide (TPR) repeat protein
MLFDLRSPGRRRFIKVIYGGLAFLMAGGLIFFGIGSDASGGLSEIFSGGGGGGDTGFEDQIEDAEKTLEENPQDTAALAELVQLHYQSGNKLVEIDEQTQQAVLTAEAEEEYTKAADAWDRYVKLTKAKIDTGVALSAVQNFGALASGLLTKAALGTGPGALDDADDSLANWNAAAEAQGLIAEQGGDAEAYRRLAEYYYFAGEFDKGDQAAQQAVGAAKGDEAKQIEDALKAAEQQGRQVNTAIDEYRKQLEKATAGAPGGAPGGATGENPLSDLGGGGLSGGGLGGP